MSRKEKLWLLNLTAVIFLLILAQVKAEIINKTGRQETSDGYEILSKIENLNKKMFGPYYFEASEALEAVNEVNNLIIRLKQIGKDDLMQKILSGNFSEGYELLEEIYFLNEEMVIEIYQEIVSEIQGGSSLIKLRDLLQYIGTITNLDRALLGFITVFYEMESNNQLYDREIFNLAHYVNDIRNMDNYHTEVSHIKKRAVDTLIKKLPVCLNNIIHSTEVNIRNVGWNNYMYAASGSRNEYLYDKDRRNVYAWVPGEMVTQGVWKMKHIREGIYNIYNVPHNEYMYAANSKYDGDRRYVFTWIPGGTNTQSEWKIELEPDYCYIKNTYWDEYLFVSLYKRDGDRRQVFTWGIKGKLETDRYFGWVIEPNIVSLG